MDILIISTIDATRGLSLEQLNPELTGRCPDYFFDEPLEPWSLIILNSEMPGTFKELSKALRQSLAKNPAQYLIVLGTNTTLPATLQGLSEHQAQPLTWQALRQDRDAVVKLYRTMRARTPQPTGFVRA